MNTYLGKHKNYVLLITLFSLFNSSICSQVSCSNFTISGTRTATYIPSQGSNCTAPSPTFNQVFWTGNNTSNGFIKYTFDRAQTSIAIWFTVVNDDDLGTINVNGGGIISLSIASGCASLTGRVLGPYTGSGGWGDVLVNIQSTIPFTEVTLVNRGLKSGFCTGDCQSVIINPTNICDPKLEKNITLCQGKSLILDATVSDATYLWQDNSTGPIFNINQEGIYWVETTLNTCNRRDSIIIQTEDCSVILEFPNIITPNNDGLNDLFSPTITKGILSMNTTIYNRWGKKIFETNNPLVEWKGQSISDGTYFWIVSYLDRNGIKKNLKGHITVLR